jgi:2-haloacid dehalogenase
MTYRSVAVFDLGGVLIDWNPRYLYRKLFTDEAAMERFLENICTSDWNTQQDAGRTLAEGCALLQKQHPEHAEYIDAWLHRYEEMIAGPIHGTVEILDELRGRGVPVYALSNWSSETFPAAQKRFEFLNWFDGMLLSGKVKLVKPDPRIFKLFLETHKVDPAQAIYIDDLAKNVDAATASGMHGIRFTDPDALRTDLVSVGLLPE